MIHSQPKNPLTERSKTNRRQENRAQSRGICDNTRAHLSKEARSGAKGRVAASEFASTRRQGPGPRDTRQRRSSPQQEDEVRGHGTRGSTGVHLVKEAKFRAEGHVAASKLTSARRRGSRPWDTWWRWSPPLQGGVVQSYCLRGSAWMHTVLLVLT
jgi:hypothetical protein